MENQLMHTFTDFEEWVEEMGLTGNDHFSNLDRFAQTHNYTVDELEAAGW